MIDLMQTLNNLENSRKYFCNIPCFEKYQRCLLVRFLQVYSTVDTILDTVRIYRKAAFMD